MYTKYSNNEVGMRFNNRENLNLEECELSEFTVIEELNLRRPVLQPLDQNEAHLFSLPRDSNLSIKIGFVQLSRQSRETKLLFLQQDDEDIFLGELLETSNLLRRKRMGRMATSYFDGENYLPII